MINFENIDVENIEDEDIESNLFKMISLSKVFLDDPGLSNGMNVFQLVFHFFGFLLLYESENIVVVNLM